MKNFWRPICAKPEGRAHWLLGIQKNHSKAASVENGSAAIHSPGAYVVNGNGQTRECKACTAKDA
jgi:hypothetical protein